LKARIPLLILFCFAADLALGLVFLVDAAWGDTMQHFHLEMEANVPTWYASAQLQLVALLLGLFACARFERSNPDTWLLALLPLVFIALSADETAGVHEWIGYRSDALLPGGSREGTALARTGIWMFVLGLPLAALLLYAVHRLRAYLSYPGVLPKFVAGLAVFLVGAAGVEVLVNFVEDGSQAHMVQVFFEEVLEMAGVTTMLWAARDLLVSAELYPVRVVASARHRVRPAGG
jgi:hypothetical protein